ncbi:MAG: hypothetical protein QNI84_01780 [Henriciella sp.]|nr:hypothetical protein [Henriciella sp.]
MAVVLAGSSLLPALAQIRDRTILSRAGIVVVWAADASGAVPMVSDFVLDTGTGSSAATSGDVDLISSDVHTVVTGTLSPTQDSFSGATGSMPFIITNTASGDIQTDTSGDGRLSSDDSFTEFGLQSLTDTRVDATRQYSSFYVASNVPFAIEAQAFNPGSTIDFIMMLVTRMTLSVTQVGDGEIGFGSAAQLPHSGGGTAGFAGAYRIWDLRTPRNVFTGDQRTAIAPGSIADQSVRFDAEYAINAENLTGYDLSLGTFDFQVEVVYTVFVP